MEYFNSRIYQVLFKQIRENKPCILTTVTTARGSTPQKPGSVAVFGKNGLIAGTLGGGFVEHQVTEKAREALLSNKSGLFDFNLANNINDDSGAICGGGMSVLLDVHPEKHQKVWENLIRSAAKREPGVLVTVCRPAVGESLHIDRAWVTTENLKDAASRLDENIRQKLSSMLNNPVQADFRQFTFNAETGLELSHIFLEAVVPPPHLIIAGAGHVGKALSHYAKLLDFEVTVWDDRPELANASNLPDADKILSGTIAESFENTVFNGNTYIVIVTRGHKDDAEVLKRVIHSEAVYIGMIGSKRKVAQVREKFISQGWATPEQWEKIYAPIGIDIHSKTVQEIALSIAAQLVKVRYENNYHE